MERINEDCMRLVINRIRSDKSVIALSATSRRMQKLTKERRDFIAFTREYRSAKMAFITKKVHPKRKKRMIYKIVDISLKNSKYWLTSIYISKKNRKQIIIFLISVIKHGICHFKIPRQKISHYSKSLKQIAIHRYST